MQLLVKTCKQERMNFERLIARLFVAAGGIFWAAALFGADFGYRDQDVFNSASSALLPLAIAVFALILGWFYENLTGVLLLIAAAGVVVWGLMAGWEETGVWWLMSGVLTAPTAVAGLLFLSAGRMQRICELEE